MSEVAAEVGPGSWDVYHKPTGNVAPDFLSDEYFIQRMCGMSGDEVPSMDSAEYLELLKVVQEGRKKPGGIMEYMETQFDPLERAVAYMRSSPFMAPEIQRSNLVRQGYATEIVDRALGIVHELQ